jgi:GTPase
MLIDEVTIKVKGGNGGHGRVSFKRNAQTAKGGPDGGNGGNGGNLYFKGVNDFTALSQFAYTKSIAAEDGIGGGKQNLYGRNGLNKIISVPFGTVVTDLKNNQSFEITSEEAILVANGGKGGRGNNEFKSATIQAPKYRELGEPGEEKELRLELKLIADIGLIGLPNAGKSSLLQALTNANPKIGDYPFTTLEPNLGVFQGLVIADIPGLIEGASSGKGLGDKFLRHVERTKLLIHCIESTSSNLKADYEVIRRELRQFNPELLEKQEILVLTKTDLLSEGELKKKFKEIEKINNNALFTSVIDDKLMEEISLKILERASAK